MRKLALVAVLALAGTLSLAACSNNNADKQQNQQQAVQKVTKPTNPNNTEAWQKYLSQVLGQHLQGMTASRPYPYLIPAGSSSAAKAGRQRQLNNVTGVVLRGVTPGNLLAFAGPSSTKTADLVVKAFQKVSPGALKGVIVLFIGDKADKARVGAVVKPTGAEYRFVAM
ncbi:MAG TPA: hypothetical protein VFJ15_10160 [Oleiagrimonas sp.]|nr:hypothetical protein [Oleiagrimonas sp.]